MGQTVIHCIIKKMLHVRITNEFAYANAYAKCAGRCTLPTNSVDGFACALNIAVLNRKIRLSPRGPKGTKESLKRVR